MLPLPKLNDEQVRLFVDRYRGLGYRVDQGERVRAELRSNMVWLDSGGLAWSNADLLDSIAPVIPSLLRAKKRTVSPKRLASMYFDAARIRGGQVLKFKLRAERGWIWRELRALGESCLTPDETKAISAALDGFGGKVSAITDYPCDGSKVRLIGRRVHYESVIDAQEFLHNLRGLNARKARNSFLSSNARLSLVGFRMPDLKELEAAFDDLGEWNYFCT